MVDRLVPRDSAVYQEFSRLYRLARAQRPTSIDRWNGHLYATDSDRLGAFDPRTCDIRLSADRTLRHLTGSSSLTNPSDQAQALATVLHEATHAGMATDAPDEPNAVRSRHSLGLMEGFAEVRALQDFTAFAERAGYPGLDLPTPTYPGAYAATQGLLHQVSGPAKDRLAIIDEATLGPGVMHFDQLADGVVRNRLAEVVPFQEEHRRQVRAALIGAMAHRAWPMLKDLSAETGRTVAEEIRQKLNSKVDEIRGHYVATRGEVFPVESPNAQVGRERVLDRGKGARGPRAVGGAGRVGAGKTGPGNTGPGNTGPGNTGPGNAGPGGGPGGGRGGAPGVGVGVGGGEGRGADGESAMRFLEGQAGAAGAVRRQPVLGDGARGRGTGEGHGQASGRDVGPGNGRGGPARE
ncbi:MAG: hypothetical protein QOH03_4546 [Kribbellaceae bacterium]|nr:hypothetical protein [Kribbellaceae bacterium]